MCVVHGFVLVCARILLAGTRTVNQPDVLPMRSQNELNDMTTPLSAKDYFYLARHQAGDASVPGLKYCFWRDWTERSFS
jgi:hypothetical protein